MDKKSKIYIAGHRGLVGSAIYRQLQFQGYKNLIGKTSKELDLTNQKLTAAFFAKEKPDYVFLAAAYVGGIQANNTFRADFIYKNLAIQNNVINSCYKNSVKKLLFLGSNCIYPKEAAQPIKEDSLLTSPLEYTNEPYAIAKIAGIKMVESFNIQYGTNYLSAMPVNLYGPNDYYGLEKGHVIPSLIRKAVLCNYLENGEFKAIAKDLKLEDYSQKTILSALAKYGIELKKDGASLMVWGTGTPYRECLYADDMAEACVYIMNNIDFKDVAHGNEIRNTHINIGTGKDMQLKDLAKLIKKIIGFNGPIVFDPSKPDGTKRKLLDVSKIHSIGWHHKIELEEGIKLTKDWYLSATNKRV